MGAALKVAPAWQDAGPVSQAADCLEGRESSGAPALPPRVAAVAAGPSHRFSKAVHPAITLVAGLGVVGDAHMGATVQHRSRVAKDPSQPNLRQVHLVHAELLEELAAAGFSVGPGDIGENVLTEGVDLLGLPRGARLLLGAEVVVEVTGLRNPCLQLDRFQDGLMEAVLDWTVGGQLVRKAGVMGVVLVGGVVRSGDGVRVELPSEHEALRPV